MKSPENGGFSRSRRFILSFVVAIGVTVSAAAQPSFPDQERLNRDIIGWFNSQRGNQEAHEIILFWPPVSAGFFTNRDPINKAELLVLVDSIPKPSATYVASGRTVDGVYATILSNRGPEQFALSKGDRKLLKDAEGLLLRNYCVIKRFYWWFRRKQSPRELSKAYRRYLGYRRQHGRVETQLAGTRDPETRKQLESELARINTQWKKRGDKDRIAKAISDFERIQSLDPEAFWADAVEQFYENVDGQFLPNTAVSPLPGDWTGSQAWLPFEFGQSSGHLKFIDIVRPWINPDVLYRHPWSWAPHTIIEEGMIVSDGSGLKTSHPERTMMQVLPVQIVLAKNLSHNGQAFAAHDPIILGVVCRVMPRLPSK